MQDLRRALADIDAIRAQLARETPFRGYGPAAIAMTGLLALALAAAQAAWAADTTDRPAAFFTAWVAAAVASAALVGGEAVTRSRRLHSGLADAMIRAAAEAFLPAGVAGFGLGLVVLRLAPDLAWALPGLWAVLTGLGVFAAARNLPRGVPFAGAWYLLAGLAALAWGAGARELSPWAMGLPFGIGGLLLAAILHRALGADDFAGGGDD